MTHDKGKGRREKGEVLFPFPLSLFPCLLVLFLPLATANSAGYRYGASDLAFYGPAVMRDLDPALFPRDGALIEAQARLTFMDETVAALARLTTDHFPTLFLGLYVLTLVLLALGAAAIAGQMYHSPWAGAALLAALTLRHAIAKSGTNTLEAYFHPRQLAFAFGVLAVGALLRGRMPAMALALAGAALLHPTTTMWFVIWVGVAIVVSEKTWRVPLAATAAAVGIASVWALSSGPLAGRLAIMDAEWLDAVAGKDYLFPMRWPIGACLLNLAYAPIIWFIYRRRAAAGVLLPRETGLVIGCLSLAGVFLIAVALGAAGVALAIQLQPARVFWMLDFLAVIYTIWALADDRGVVSRRPGIVAASLLALSVARGGYVMFVEFPDRPLFEVAVPGDWGRVSAWAQTTSRDSGWLADPGHASTYGTSWRMAAARDVFVEATKDAAVGMYDRSVAFRTRDRVRAVGDFTSLTAERARALASEYDLDYLVTEAQVELPIAFQSGAIRVYRLQ